MGRTFSVRFELAGGVFFVGVEADSDGAGAEVVGEPVVVVPAVAVLAGVAVGADAGEWCEVEFTVGGEGADADAPGTRVEVDACRWLAGAREFLGFDEHGLFDALFLCAATRFLG